MQRNPLLSYGESIFILIQNIILVFLLWTYSSSASSPSVIKRVVISVSMAALTGFFFLIPMEYQYLLPLSNLPLLACSRVSQIYANFSNKSTGQLSLITFLLSWLGTVARLFTTIQTVGWDYAILAGLALSFFLSTVIILQVHYLRLLLML